MHFNSDTICHDRDHLLPCRSWLQSSRLCALNQAFAGISFQKVRLFLFYADRDNRKPVSLRGSERPLPKKTRLVFIEVSKVFPRCTNNYFILLRRKTLSLQGRGYKALVATQPKNVLFLIYKYTNVHRFAIQQNHQNAYVQGKTQRHPCCRLKRKLHEPDLLSMQHHKQVQPCVSRSLCLQTLWRRNACRCKRRSQHPQKVSPGANRCLLE